MAAALPTEDTVHVWRARVSANLERAAALEAALDDEERDRLGRFKVAGARDRYLVAHVAARDVLARCLATRPGALAFDRTCARCGAAHGKPSLPDWTQASIQFNLSHSDDLVLVAVAVGRDVGVDVEAVRPTHHDIDHRVLAPSEQAVMDAAHPEDRPRLRMQAWARKEAFVKATGEGIGRGLSSVVVLGPGGSVCLDVPEAADWTLVDVDAGPSYAAAVAASGSGWDVRLHDW